MQAEKENRIISYRLNFFCAKYPCAMLVVLLKMLALSTDNLFLQRSLSCISDDLHVSIERCRMDWPAWNLQHFLYSHLQTDAALIIWSWQKLQTSTCLSLFVLQKVSEKVGGAEGTKLDDDFTEMEKASLNSFIDHHHENQCFSLLLVYQDLY